MSWTNFVSISMFPALSMVPLIQDDALLSNCITFVNKGKVAKKVYCTIPRGHLFIRTNVEQTQASTFPLGRPIYDTNYCYFYKTSGSTYFGSQRVLRVLLLFCSGLNEQFKPRCAVAVGFYCWWRNCVASAPAGPQCVDILGLAHAENTTVVSAGGRQRGQTWSVWFIRARCLWENKRRGHTFRGCLMKPTAECVLEETFCQLKLGYNI